MKIRTVPPKCQALEELPNVIHKWEKVISDTARNELLSLKTKIENHSDMQFVDLMTKIESKAVVPISVQTSTYTSQSQTLAETTSVLSGFETSVPVINIPDNAHQSNNTVPVRRSTRKRPTSDDTTIDIPKKRKKKISKIAYYVPKLVFLFLFFLFYSLFKSFLKFLIMLLHKN